MKKKKLKKDPHAKRESQRYENPIPSREFLLSLIEEQQRLLTYDELLKELQLEGEQTIALKRRLTAMCRDGQLMQDRKRRYGPVKKLDLFSGEVSAHRDGYGFLLCDQGGKDIFLPAWEMKTLFNGDRVLVRVVQAEGSRLEASVVEVLERAVSSVIGQLRYESGVYYVVPEHKRISQDLFIPIESLNGAKEGQAVQAEIVHYPERSRPAVGKVIEILGNYLDPGMEIEMSINNYGILNTWSEECEKEAEKVPNVVHKADIQGREDLRALPLVTIDGEDAKDFDDGVYCQRLESGGWKLIVAIADVGHYVARNSALDQEALRRGNSVYFPGRVVPMLPESLSNGICSLKPEVDRLCLACELIFDEDGERQSYRFFEAVMHSHARLTYTKVAGILDDSDYESMKEFSALLPAIYELNALYERLLAARNRRGAIDFASTETRIVFGTDKKIDYITPVERNVAHRIIEECMLAANVAASEFAQKHRAPILFRNHEAPPMEKVTGLREFLHEFGLRLEGGDAPEPRHYVKLNDQIADRNEAHMLGMAVLRSLTQAIYTPENHGHFGLAFDSYTHFTSPIRRYPDLILHRVIKSILHKDKADRLGVTELEVLGEHCSHTERRADEATRDVEAWLKCEYMQDKQGEVFTGVVTGVTNFGLFTELSDIYVEGLIHVSSLKNDFYHYDQTRHALIGERSHKSYRLGDSVNVIVAAVDLDARKVDLVLAEGLDENKTNQPKGKKRRKKRKKDRQ